MPYGRGLPGNETESGAEESEGKLGCRRAKFKQVIGGQFAVALLSRMSS